MSGVPRRIRDVVVGTLSHVGGARRRMANAAVEVDVNYTGSPIVVGDRPRHAKVAAGEHLPHVANAAVQRQLAAVFGAHNLGHIVVTVASDNVLPAAGGNSEAQVLVSRNDTPVAGYDAVIADPDGVLLDCLGLKNGGRLIVRPDGYVGPISTLDDTNAIADYFARIAS